MNLWRVSAGHADPWCVSIGTSAFGLIAILALSLYGVRMALAGQPLFKDD